MFPQTSTTSQMISLLSKKKGADASGILEELAIYILVRTGVVHT